MTTAADREATYLVSFGFGTLLREILGNFVDFGAFISSTAAEAPLGHSQKIAEAENTAASASIHNSPRCLFMYQLYK
jgi:hypothetical protein